MAEPPAAEESLAEAHKPTAEKTIRTLEEWEACKDVKGPVLLLQCGSPVCEKCPGFTQKIEELKLLFHFQHVYVNTHDAEEEFIDELQVTKLPAYFLVANKTQLAHAQSASPDLLAAAVTCNCTPVFTTDADF